MELVPRDERQLARVLQILDTGKGFQFYCIVNMQPLECFRQEKNNMIWTVPLKITLAIM